MWTKEAIKKRFDNFMGAKNLPQRKYFPNLFLKSNYFLPTKDTKPFFISCDNKKGFKELCVINNKNTRLFYSGHRCNMYDFWNYCLLLNKAKEEGTLELKINGSDLMRLLGVSYGAKKIIVNSLFKMKDTSFYFIKDEFESDIFTLFSDFEYIKKDNGRTYINLSFKNSIDYLLVDNFTYMGTSYLKKFKTNQTAIKFYSLLMTNKAWFYITKDNLVNMCLADINAKRQFLKSFYTRVLKPVEEAGAIHKWGKTKTNYYFLVGNKIHFKKRN